MDVNGEKMLEKLEVVPASPQDAEGIINLMSQSWITTFPNEKLGITEQDIRNDLKDYASSQGVEEMKRNIDSPKPGQTILLAKRGETIIGYCRVIKRSDENELESFHVLPSVKGQGIGSALWKAAQKHTDSEKPTILWVATYNQDSINVYKHLGFEVTEDRKDERLVTDRPLARPMMKMVKKGTQEPSPLSHDEVI